MDLTTTIIGVALPAYSSFKAIKNKSSFHRLHWLRYWTVFAVYLVLARVTDLVLYWLPLYELIKTIFLLFLVHQRATGAQIVYRSVLAPLLINNEKAIDRFMRQKKKQIFGTLWSFVTICGLTSSVAVLQLVQGVFTPAAEGQSSGDHKEDSGSEEVDAGPGVKRISGDYKVTRRRRVVSRPASEIADYKLIPDAKKRLSNEKQLVSPRLLVKSLDDHYDDYSEQDMEQDI